MKKIGLIGGMSWESTQVYYQVINKKTNELLSGHHSAACLLYSFDFTELPLLLKPTDTVMPLFDTTLIHAETAVDFSLG
ncbi:MAG: hypothetical protein ACOCXH_14345 [Cyclobacteriaceae bacterium]